MFIPPSPVWVRKKKIILNPEPRCGLLKLANGSVCNISRYLIRSAWLEMLRTVSQLPRTSTNLCVTIWVLSSVVQHPITAFQITGNKIICSTVHLRKQQNKHQSCALLALNPLVTSGFPHKRPVIYKPFVQQLVQTNNKEIDHLHYWPFVRAIHSLVADFCHKGPVMYKLFVQLLVQTNNKEIINPLQ